jgi:hypothetical protein
VTDARPGHEIFRHSGQTLGGLPQGQQRVLERRLFGGPLLQVGCQMLGQEELPPEGDDK